MNLEKLKGRCQLIPLIRKKAFKMVKAVLNQMPCNQMVQEVTSERKIVLCDLLTLHQKANSRTKI